MPPRIAPKIGATQKSQSRLRAQPPTMRAGPVLPAGLTEVLVTGMLMRWIGVSPRPMAMGAKPLGRVFVRCAQDDEQEKGSKDDFRDEAGEQLIAVGRVLCVAVRGESLGQRETGLRLAMS